MSRQSIHSAFFILWGCTLAVIISCKPGVPRRYIQPSDMENILYDYHVADGMAMQLSTDRTVYQRAYRLAVLKKHGITEAEFDSSLVYYTRHTDHLHTIYEHLAKRMSDEAVSLGASASGADRYGSLSATGDTAAIRIGEGSAIFVPKPPFNQLSFSIKADSAFHKGDVILLHFKAQFIYQDGVRDGIAVLAVRFSNDSTTSQVQRISNASSYTLQVRDDNHIGIKEINGFIMLNKSLSPDQSSTTLQIMSVSRLRLIRIHEEKVKQKDRVTTDSLKTDSTSVEQQKSTEPQPATDEQQPPTRIPPTEPHVGNESPALPREIPTR